MAATLIQAIIEVLDTVAGLPTVYFTEVPEDMPLVPAAVLLHEGEMPIYSVPCMVPTSVAGRFQIHLYGISTVALEALAGDVMSAFTTTVLSIDSDPNTRCYRELYRLQGLENRDKESRRVYRAILAYSVKFNVDR